jgi:hypothetical protein
VWNKLTDQEKQIFTEVTREAAVRATAQIKKREAELADEFKKKGLQIVQVNKQSFIDAVLKVLDPGVDGFTKSGLRQDRRDQVAPVAWPPPAWGRAAESCRGRRAGWPRPAVEVPQPARCSMRTGIFTSRMRRSTSANTSSRIGRRSAFFWLLGLNVFYQFFTRYVLNDSAAWTEEIARYLLICTVFMGVAASVRRTRHIHVDFLYRLIPPRWAACCRRWWTSVASCFCAAPSA